VTDFIAKHYPWFFSGLGVFLLGGLLTFVKSLTAAKKENHPALSVHTQNIALRARDYHESYDHALGIFIANTGDSNIHIARALFKNKVPFLLFFKKASALPVYPRAFKDTQLDAYELKFGEQWYNPQTDIVGRGRVMTYLPLTEEVPDTQINKRKHGQVLLRYSSGDKAGTHKVYV
jgi:hypothetical protein